MRMKSTGRYLEKEKGIRPILKSRIREIQKNITYLYQLKNNTKVNAFTLSEILVVIVISTIVVGLALSVLNLVQQNYNNIRKNYQISTDVQLLKQQITVDFNRFHGAVLNNKLQEIHFKNALDSIYYIFSGELLIRKMDTLSIQIENPIFYFRGQVVENGKIDAMKLYIKGQPGTYIFVDKVNDAKTYLDGN
jgi:competence protein ComGC